MAALETWPWPEWLAVIGFGLLLFSIASSIKRIADGMLRGPQPEDVLREIVRIADHLETMAEPRPQDPTIQSIAAALLALAHEPVRAQVSDKTIKDLRLLSQKLRALDEPPQAKAGP